MISFILRGGGGRGHGNPLSNGFSWLIEILFSEFGTPFLLMIYLLIQGIPVISGYLRKDVAEIYMEESFQYNAFKTNAIKY